MTARRFAALSALAVAVGLCWVALLTPLRSAEIAALDAEAQRLGEEWNEVSTSGGSGNLLGASDEAQRLLEESNQAYAAARDLEPPLDPLRALGGALLAVATGVAVWPTRAGSRDEVTAPAA